MAKNKNRGHRETRKPPQEILEVPDLGRLSQQLSLDSVDPPPRNVPLSVLI